VVEQGAGFNNEGNPTAISDELSITPTTLDLEERPTVSYTIIARDESESSFGNAREETVDDKDVITPQNSTTTPDPIIDEVWVYAVALKFSFVSHVARRLNHLDVLTFEHTVSKLCLEYYASLQDDASVERGGGEWGNVRRHRHLQEQRRRDARDVIQANVLFVHQEMSYDANGMPSNVITYNQHFVFESSGEQVDNDDGDSPLFTPSELVKLPFKDITWNMRLGNELKRKSQAFTDIELPLETPIVPDQNEFLLKVDADDSRKALSQGQIAAIFVVAAFVFTVAGSYGLRVINIPMEPQLYEMQDSFINPLSS